MWLFFVRFGQEFCGQLELGANRELWLDGISSVKEGSRKECLWVCDAQPFVDKSSGIHLFRLVCFCRRLGVEPKSLDFTFCLRIVTTWCILGNVNSPQILPHRRASLFAQFSHFFPDASRTVL